MMKFSVQRTLLVIGAVLLGAVLAGCGRSPRYLTQSKPGVDVSAYTSYAVLKMGDTMPGAEARIVNRIRPIIENSIHTTLQAKGYKKADVEEADFVLVANASVIPRTNLRAKGYTPAYTSNGWHSEFGELETATNDVDEPDDRALVALEAYDTTTKELVWFSISSSIRRPDVSNSDRIGRARDLVLRLASEFPTAHASH